MRRNDHTLAFIGCGMIGEAMIQGVLRDGLIDADRIVASHPRADRLETLEQRYGIRTTPDNAAAAAEADLLVLAVKPQFLDEVFAEIRRSVSSETTVITVIAGARLGRFREELGTPRVVRVMPNTPARIGRGMSVWTATDAVDEADRNAVRSILSALGVEEYVTHESELDMATALSGTGPAYVFLFMESLIDAGVHMGFSRRVAEKLVFETVLGAAAYAKDAPDHLAKLRNQVTSPGGTTAEAHYQLERGGLRTVMTDAVWAAYRRCRDLGDADAGEPRPGPSS